MEIILRFLILFICSMQQRSRFGMLFSILNIFCLYIFSSAFSITISILFNILRVAFVCLFILIWVIQTHSDYWWDTNTTAVKWLWHHSKMSIHIAFALFISSAMMMMMTVKLHFYKYFVFHNQKMNCDHLIKSAAFFITKKKRERGQKLLIQIAKHIIKCCVFYWNLTFTAIFGILTNFQR